MEFRSCAICCEPIAELEIMYYFPHDSSEPPPAGASAWIEFPYCEQCVDFLKKTQVENYFAELRRSDCKRELLALIEKGYPCFLRDSKVFQEHQTGEPRWHRIGRNRVVEAAVVFKATDSDLELLATYQNMDRSHLLIGSTNQNDDQAV